MSSRRSKPVPPPILAPPQDDPQHVYAAESSATSNLVDSALFPERGAAAVASTATGSATRGGGGGAVADGGGRTAASHSHAPMRHSHVQQRAGATEPAATEPPVVHFSPTSRGAAVAGASAFSTQVSVTDGQGLGASERVVLEKQTTNTRAIIDLVQMDFSDAMRGYRVCKQGPTARPWLRLFSVNDMVLLALAVSFLLSCVVSLNGLATHEPSALVAKTRRLRWPKAAPPSTDGGEERTRLRALREESFFFKVRLALCVCCLVLAIVRFALALQQVYVEEVIAIRGLGIQLTDYGVFGRIKRRRFIDVKLIRSLVIHDAFFRYQPIFFLSSSLENESRRVVYFAETLPRLAALQIVLRGLRHVLYGEEEVGPSLSSLEQMQSSSQQQQVASDDDTYTRSDESVLEGSQDSFLPPDVGVGDQRSYE